jgi:hypothetical protein|tara:strand:- start:77 stop:382 length:306 start_codon:yes stop_codon:yes gene_type:complete
VILDQLEKALMIIGGKVIMASGGQKNFDEHDIADDNVTSELVIKPRQPAFTKPHENRASLNNKTKRAICDQCLEDFGVELNIRPEKKFLITAFLAVQETYG